MPKWKKKLLIYPVLEQVSLILALAISYEIYAVCMAEGFQIKGSLSFEAKIWWSSFKWVVIYDQSTVRWDIKSYSINSGNCDISYVFVYCNYLEDAQGSGLSVLSLCIIFKHQILQLYRLNIHFFLFRVVWRQEKVVHHRNLAAEHILPDLPNFYFFQPWFHQWIISKSQKSCFGCNVSIAITFVVHWPVLNCYVFIIIIIICIFVMYSTRKTMKSMCSLIVNKKL